jgi:hypothetical protein
MAARTRFIDTLDEVDSKIAENRAARFEARQERFAAVTEAALRASEDRATGAEFEGRIAAILGDAGGVTRAGEVQVEALREQQRVLQGRLAAAQGLAARDPRWQSVVDDLAEELRNTSISIVERQSQLLTDAVSAMETASSRRLTAIDLRERAAGLMERAGDRLGAIGSRMGTTGDRIGILRQQQADYLGLRGRAEAEGNMGVVQDLNDKLAELATKIDEEVAALNELNFTYRQTATEIITGRVARSTGLIGAASGIFGQIDRISGTQNFERLAALLNQSLGQLATAATEIGNNVRDAADEFSPEGNNVLSQLAAAFAGGPESFATTLAALAPQIAALEATMGETERGAFQALIQSMIDNTTAVLDNTGQLEEITNASQNPQSWSSTAWNWFREAIFTGMGDVLPTYTVPQMHTGGLVTKGGLAELAAAEFVVAANRDNLPGGGDLYDIDINEAHNPDEVAQRVMNRIAFDRKTRGK